MKFDLNLNLSLKKDVLKKESLPTKKNINFAHYGQKKNRIEFIVPITIITVLFLVIFSYFFIVTPLFELHNMNVEVDALQDELNVSYKRLENYTDLESDYAHYSYSGYKDYELLLPDRDAVTSIVYDVILPKCSVNKWTVEDNRLFVSIVDSDVKTVNDVSKLLETKPIVSYCDIQMASKNQDTRIDAQLTIYLNLIGGVQ